MTRELIIEGQHVDLADNTDITLEYVSNVLTGGSGKINLSRSYTIKLPKTVRNARILDDPGRPSHASSGVRRFLEARYYVNGIDLLGEAQVYVLRTAGDSYELALVWNALPQLQALSESAQTLNDLQGLPVLAWIGANGATPDYTGETDGALFAWYDSGLGGHAYPDVNAATHPSISVRSLLGHIMEQAGVPYSISSQRVAAALEDLYVLAAPSHKPSREMEIASGSRCGNLSMSTGQVTLLFDTISAGWDAPITGSPTNSGLTGEVKTLHVACSIKAPDGLDLSGAYFSVNGFSAEGSIVSGEAELERVYFMRGGDGAFVVNAELDVDVSAWERFSLQIKGAPGGTVFTSATAGVSPLMVWRVHEAIDIAYDNRFPIGGNLPDLKQWDFVQAALVLCGAVPVIQNGALLIMGYDEAFDRADAYDWTDKVTETDAVAYSAQEWARENVITYEREDGVPLSFNPDVTIEVQDGTLPRQRELYALPFAATQYGSIIHYNVNDEGEAEDLDIQPRIMQLRKDAERNELVFGPELYGDGLKSAYYSELQNVVASPVLLTLQVRLHELDLAGLDLRRPVYLRQYGHYYSIISVQTSDTVCKVELIQIP